MYSEGLAALNQLIFFVYQLITFKTFLSKFKATIGFVLIFDIHKVFRLETFMSTKFSTMQ